MDGGIVLNANELFEYDNNYLLNLVKDLEEYIQDELQDSDYYEKLSSLAPSNISKETLLEFSNDEKLYAENFQNIYCVLKGDNYIPKPLPLVKITEYDQSLIERIAEETRDYKKYGQHYLDAPTNYLQDLFFSIRDIKAQHAMRIPVLLEEVWS